MKIGYVSVRIGMGSPIKLVLPYHMHVGTLEKEIVRKRELNNSGTRHWSNGPSARPHGLVIRINDGYGWGIRWSFELLLKYVGYDKKFLDERSFLIKLGRLYLDGYV
ncbi:hypothetical protein Tco_0276196 [Tanacetum coccineum]